MSVRFFTFNRISFKTKNVTLPLSDGKVTFFCGEDMKCSTRITERQKEEVRRDSLTLS